MYITVDGAKRNLRIGILNPTKGWQSLAKGFSPMIASATADLCICDRGEKCFVTNRWDSMSRNSAEFFCGNIPLNRYE
ncbi:MAG: hypothetical protein LBU34_06370 [Planctomycetaceae bacterium]|nr:hypothetical protein [Planctomycetaceae bacterium]